MALSDIEEKILSDAESEAGEIRKEAAILSGHILEKAEQEGKRAYDRIIEGARHEAGQKERQILATARLKARDRLLACKGEIVDKVFDEAFKGAVNTGGPEYEKLLNKLFKQIGNIEEGAEIILPGAKAEETKKIVIENTKGARIKFLSDPGDFSGGFVLRMKGATIDCSLEAVFKKVREEIEGEVVKILFA